MNNKELFIKYLDDQLEQKELKSFDTQLLEDVEFKNQFLTFRNKFENSRASIPADERYFNTLIPNSKAREKESKKKSYLKLAYALPIIAIILFATINDSKNEANFNNSFSGIFDEFTNDNDLTTDLLNNAFNMEDNYSMNEELISEYYSEEIDLDESMFEYLENNTYIEDVSNNLVDQLSDAEFLSLHNALIEKKIL